MHVKNKCVGNIGVKKEEEEEYFMNKIKKKLFFDSLNLFYSLFLVIIFNSLKHSMFCKASNQVMNNVFLRAF